MRRWGWGRTGEGAPLSRPSYAIVGVILLLVGYSCSAPAGPAPSLWVALMFACFIGMLVAGFVDTYLDRRRKPPE